MTRSVLIVDYEAALCLSLEHLMKANGYSVTTTDSGQKAIDHARQYQPDLILLDTSLPDRDGYEICQALRSMPETRNIKIIMLSTGSRDVEIEKGLAAGASAFLTKPFPLETLIRTTSVVMGDSTNNSSDVF